MLIIHYLYRLFTPIVCFIVDYVDRAIFILWMWNLRHKEIHWPFLRSHSEVVSTLDWDIQGSEPWPCWFALSNCDLSHLKEGDNLTPETTAFTFLFPLGALPPICMPHLAPLITDTWFLVSQTNEVTASVWIDITPMTPRPGRTSGISDPRGGAASFWTAGLSQKLSFKVLCYLLGVIMKAPGKGKAPMQQV